MVRIKRIDEVSAANIAAFISLALSMVVAIPFGLLVLSRALGDDVGAANVAPGFIILLFLGPFGAAAATWVVTALACLAYNVAVRFTGGVRVHLADVPAAEG